jgi:hypothetical protein
MFVKVAAFELRYQLKAPVFWVAAILVFLLTYGSVTTDAIQIGATSNVHVNSPAALIQVCLIFSLFFMFFSTALVANVVVRDDDTGFGPIIRATRITKFDYLYGRFAGALVAVALAFLAVPLAGEGRADPPPGLPLRLCRGRPAEPLLHLGGLLRARRRHPIDDGELCRGGGVPGALHHRQCAGGQAGVSDAARLSGALRHRRLWRRDAVLDR